MKFEAHAAKKKCEQALVGTYTFDRTSTDADEVKKAQVNDSAWYLLVNALEDDAFMYLHAVKDKSAAEAWTKLKKRYEEENEEDLAKLTELLNSSKLTSTTTDPTLWFDKLTNFHPKPD